MVFINLGYGDWYSGINSEPIKTIKAGSFLLGGMIHPDKRKSMVIELGAGHTFGAPAFELYGITIDIYSFTPVVGLAQGLAEKSK